MLKRISLFLLIFSLPFQLGYHFWLPQSYVASFRIDYLAPVLYLTDIFIFLFLAANFRQAISALHSFFARKMGWLYLGLIFLNLYASSFNPVTLLAWLRLSLYLLLLAVLAQTKALARKTLLPFTFSLTLIILLALLQFISQSSLGSFFYYLGERPLSLALPQVAKIDTPWGQILRPYATFSHPNSLAGYLLVSLLVLFLIYPKKKMVKIPLGFSILLTFSKAALFSFVMIEILELTFVQGLVISIALSLAPLLKGIIEFPAWLAQSINTRHFLLLPALKILTDDLLLGVGLKQFIPGLAAIIPASQTSSATLQPVHNTFILMFAELGLVGTLILIRLFWTPISKLVKNQRTRPYLLELSGIVLMTGALDHYWWTLPQNQLIIILALALILNKSNDLRKNHH